jgi:mono/diheme cytochrome c family protein
MGCGCLVVPALVFMLAWPLECRADTDRWPISIQQFVQAHCVTCHSGSEAAGELDLEAAVELPPSSAPAAWESVLRKLLTHQMPPFDADQPSAEARQATIEQLGQILDHQAATRLDPGRTETLRRLTRTEYRNAVRDLVAIELDMADLLPADEASHGFDNVTVSSLSPTQISRYLSAAQKISRLAVGRQSSTVIGETIRVRPDITQDTHRPGLPLGSRGGILTRHLFPGTGEYEIQVRLMRDRNEELEGLRGKHELQLRLDRKLVKAWELVPPGPGQDDRAVDADLKLRIPVTAGPHELAVTFPEQSKALSESLRQPLNVHFNYYRHPRLGPAVFEVSIVGPFESSAPGDTPSRRQIFDCYPEQPEQESQCATAILKRLSRRAFRRTATSEELSSILEAYDQGRREGDFELGIERAFAAILMHPRFLLRVELDPPDAVPGTAYRISDLELASRLSFFLWSSLPDDPLLRVAEQGRLSDPDELNRQVERMLADPRSGALVENFAGQWLYLRNLDAVMPDMRLFPDFDHNLREAMREECERFLTSMLAEDRSVLELIRADYTYLNERLARHYQIPFVHGTRFRRVHVPADSHRGGLLRQAGILTVTSYATRTSPVLRGKWILENLLASPPPPPPPDVPALEDATVLGARTIREQLALHRAHEACAGCHQLIDPVGFPLESYDAVGRWRSLEGEQPVDVWGGLPGSDQFAGVQGLEQALLDRPEAFVTALAEKLLTYALGRGVEYADGPAVRAIVSTAHEQDYRWSSIIKGVVQSHPFLMRRAADANHP